MVCIESFHCKLEKMICIVQKVVHPYAWLYYAAIPVVGRVAYFISLCIETSADSFGFRESMDGKWS